MRPTSDPDTVAQALAEPSRRAILENLRFGQKTVSELVAATELKQPNVSNHLARMREQGIVRAERIGRNVYYTIALPVADLLLQMHEHVAVHAPHSAPPVRERDSEALPTGNSDAPLPIGAWQEAYFADLLAGQEDRATALVNRFLAARLSLETIYVEIFQWALQRVGEYYVQGRIDEAHEHLASEITERQMARVAPYYTPVARLPYRALLGSVEGNWHTLGLRMLSDGLRSLGWETRFLGASVPTESFVAMTVETRPDLVVASCVLQEQTAELQNLFSQLAEQRSHHVELRYRMVAGGWILNTDPHLLAALPVDFTARSLPEFLQNVRTFFPVPAREKNFP